MNFKNLIMWGIIVLLSVGLFNIFKIQKKLNLQKNISFSKFLTEVDSGRVVQVNIQGNNISGVLSDGKIKFNTYSPNYPNLVEKLSEKGVSIVATPKEDKMPSFRNTYYLGFQCFCLLVYGYFLCVKCKVEKVEQWVLENLKLNY